MITQKSDCILNKNRQKIIQFCTIFILVFVPFFHLSANEFFYTKSRNNTNFVHETFRQFSQKLYFKLKNNIPANVALADITLPYTEDFEGASTGDPGTLPAGWINEASDGSSTCSGSGGSSGAAQCHDWQVHTGATPSSSPVGPNADHSSGSGTYVYYEDSGNTNSEANLISPSFDLSGTVNPEVSVWVYSQSDAGIIASFGGTTENLLHFDVMNSTGASVVASDITMTVGDTDFSDWIQYSINLSDYINSGEIRLRFRVTNNTSTSGSHDIALDDFVIQDIGVLPTTGIICAPAITEITGKVFEDYDFDGSNDFGETFGFNGVSVTAIDASGNTTTTVTNADGNYTLSGLIENTTYRIEFTNLPAGTSPTLRGADNGTRIQFIQSGNCANLGVLDISNGCLFRDGSGGTGDSPGWVTIGDTSNPADGNSYSTTVNGSSIVHDDPNQVGRGAVNYEYWILDNHIRVRDFLGFLNSVDPTNSTERWEGGLLHDGVVTYDDSEPIGSRWKTLARNTCTQVLTAEQLELMILNYTSFKVAARYANWAATGDINEGAYTFSDTYSADADITAIDSNWDGLRLITEDELYKALYWDQANLNYNLYGTTTIQANGIPIESDVDSDGILTVPNGNVYNISSGCFKLIRTKQSGQSPYGLYFGLGDYHDMVVPYDVIFPMTSNVVRPDNQLRAEENMRSSYRFDTDLSYNNPFPSPGFRLAASSNPCVRPIEIGNYVWTDTNNDGIQDANETGINGITVELIREGAVIASTQTTNGGEYYFSSISANDANLNWTGTGTDTALVANTTYTIRISNAEGDNQQAVLNGFVLGTADANSNNSDDIDNDAILSGNDAEITFTTGEDGEVNHSLDVGFYYCEINIQSVVYANCVETSPNVFEAEWDISVLTIGLEGETVNYRRNSETNATFTPVSGNTSTALTIAGVPADGGVYDTIYIFSASDNSCSDTMILKRPSPCPIEVAGTSEPAEVCQNLTNSEIGGTVFEDWNFDGAMNQTDTIGVQGIQVDLYDDCGDITQTTYTDKNGNYLFNGLTTGIDYRVEFTLPESVACWAKTTKAGPDNGTTVQFVQPGNCASLGLANSSDYCQENPAVLVPCFVAGDPLSGNAIFDTFDAFVSFNYNADVNSQAGNTPLAFASDIGNTWGVAYQRESKTVFTAATLKRHFGFGTIDGVNPTTGGIYALEVDDLANPNVLKWLDVNTIGINTGANPRDGSPANSLGDLPTIPSFDAAAYTQVGKVGIGDIDMQDDKTLWLINLNDRSLYGIQNINPNVTPIAADVLGPYSLPSTGCGSGEQDVRPWALKVYKNKVYIGAVCTGESSQDSLDLHAYIFEFDPNTTTMTSFYDFDMNYERGRVDVGGSFDTGDWRAWQTTWGDHCERPNGLGGGTPSCDGKRTNQQPILADIEFDADGSMILGVMDRWGLQTQDDFYRPDPTAMDSTQYWLFIAPGDVLRVCNVDGDYVFEGGAGCSQSPPNTNGGGADEYYHGDHGTKNNTNILRETALGALLYLSGDDEVMTTQWDPYTAYNSAGTTTLFNDTGNFNRRKLIYGPTSPGPIPPEPSDGYAAKGVGLGDLEARCNAAPIEIGNYVWEDTNGDGIQNACEPALAGIEVSLYDANCNLLASILTAADGSYYFNSSVVGIDEILPNTDYFIVITDNDFNTSSQELVIGNQYYELTYDKISDKGNINSDASIGTEDCYDQMPYIPVTTGEAGCVLHDFDIGFRPTECEVIVHSVETSNCTGSDTTYTTDFNVEIHWSATPIGEDIQVILNGGMTQTINVSSGLTSPQTVTFTGISADGNGTEEIIAYFSTSTACRDTLTIKSPSPCPADVTNNCTNPAGIQGKAFDDLNYNGVNDEGNSGVQGIEVRLFDCDNNLVGASYTDADGDYQFPSANNGETYRVEFILNEAIACNYCFTHAGIDNGTNVQFVTAPVCANIGVSAPAAYCEADPYLITTCFVGRDPQHDNLDVMVGFPYNSGTPRGPGNNLPRPEHIAIDSQIGSTFGIAYHKATGSMLAASYFKWSTGYGPAGQDAIYNVNAGTDKIFGTGDDNISTFIEFDNLFGVNSTGYDPYYNSTHRWGDGSLVGKVSFGDIEFSNNRNELYVMNLGDRKIYTIPVGGNPLSYDATNIQISSKVPQAASCTGTMRPFTIEVSLSGKVFVGAVCENDSRKIYVWEYLPSSNTWSNTPALETTLTSYTGWCCWGRWGSTSFQRGSMFTGLEIDQDGNLTIALRDRKTERSRTRNMGDILKACGDEINGWTLESNAECGGQIGSRPDVGEGPNRGEFYNDTSADGSERSIMGGLYAPRGTNEVVASFDDPFRTFTGGMAWFDLTSGEKNNQYQVTDVVFNDVENIDGKRAILGEMDGVCSDAPLEIGNRVWLDTNENGIQDACEEPIENVNVSLYKNGTKIAETQTSVTGQYYFSDKNATDANLVWTGTDADTMLLPNMEYKIVFGENQYANNELTIGSEMYSLTIQNEGINDRIDSDAMEMDVNGTTFPAITAMTGDYGCTDHSFDVGFVLGCPPEICLPIKATIKKNPGTN